MRGALTHTNTHAALYKGHLQIYWWLWTKSKCLVSLSLRSHAHGTLAKRLMHMAHKSGNTSGVLKSSSDWLNYTGFPGDVCVSRSLTFHLETKMPWCQTLSRKKKAVVFTTVMTNAYQDQINTEFSKVCKIFKVRGIESLKYVREFYTQATFPRPQMWRWRKRTVIGCLTCRSNGLMGGALANESYHRFQTFSRQSEGLATRD